MSSISNVAGAGATMVSHRGPSQGGLQTELSKLKREHSACVNCESARTLEGKLTIQKLEIQIGTVESKLAQQQVTETRASDSPAAATTAPNRVDLYA